MHCKRALLLTIAGSALVALATSAGAQSFTTRIVTHDYSGAIVSREHGVRVIRPLPPERQVIINPDRVPLSLSYSDTRIYGYVPPSSAGDAGEPRYGRDGDIYYAPAWGRGFRGHRGFNHFNGRRGGMPVIQERPDSIMERPTAFRRCAKTAPGRPTPHTPADDQSVWPTSDL